MCYSVALWVNTFSKVSQIQTTFIYNSWHKWVNPFMPIYQTKPPDNLGDISLTTTIFRKYLKENRSSELYLKLSFIILANSCLIPKLFLNVFQVQTTLVKHISRHQWVKRKIIKYHLDMKRTVTAPANRIIPLRLSVQSSGQMIKLPIYELCNA